MSVTLGPSDIYICRNYRGILGDCCQWPDESAASVHIELWRIGYNWPTNRPEEAQATDLHLLAKKIAAFLPDHETLTLSQIVKLRLKELVAKGYLVPKELGRGAHFQQIQGGQQISDLTSSAGLPESVGDKLDGAFLEPWRQD